MGGGAEAANGLQSTEWSVLKLVGTKLKLQDSVVAEWINAMPAYAAEFKDMMNKRTREYMDILVEAF